MRAEAFGEIGIKPSEFYRLDIEDYSLMREGFLKNRVWFENILRLSVSYILQPYAKEGRSIDPFDLWECYGDEELKKNIKELRKQKSTMISEASMKILREFKEKEAQQNSKEN